MKKSSFPVFICEAQILIQQHANLYTMEGIL